MADFCRKCATRLGFDPDLTIEVLEIKENHYISCLCEGCGTQIFVMNYQGKEVVFRPDSPVVM